MGGVAGRRTGPYMLIYANTTDLSLIQASMRQISDAFVKKYGYETLDMKVLRSLPAC